METEHTEYFRHWFNNKKLVGAEFGTVVSFLFCTFSFNKLLSGFECTIREGMAASELVLTSRADGINTALF